MPIRVLHVVTYMCRGGLETFIMNHYRKIDRSKVQFDFLVHRDFIAEYDKEILELGGRIYRLPRLNPFSSAYLSKLDNFFASHPEYKIVHSHLDCMAGIPLKYAKKHGVPVRIAHSHNSNQTKDIKYPLKLFFKRNIRNFANRLFACSKEAGQWMFSTDKFTVFPNAIDVEKYAFDDLVRNQIRRELGLSSTTLVLGHVGRFSHQKNHSFLIDILKKCTERNIDAVAVLVGEGELLENIKSQVAKLQLNDRVIFAGVRSDVYRILQAMDVFVFPSFYEGLPLTIVEAQASGITCLISDKVPIECKMTDLVHQLSLDSGPDRWAEFVLQFQHTPRPDTFAQIRDRGFDVQDNAQKLMNFYLEQYQLGEE